MDYPSSTVLSGGFLMGESHISKLASFRILFRFRFD